MDLSEKKILAAGIEMLERSTRTSWESGGLPEWVDFAKRMKTTISTFASMVTPLIEIDKEEVTKKAESPKLDPLDLS